MKAKWQAQMDAAFESYFAMSAALQEDVEAILRIDDDSQSYRRNFIRAACSLIEGYGHCFRTICAIGLETGPGRLSEKEVTALKDERSFGSADRTRLTLRAAFRMLELPRSPQFGDPGWSKAKALLRKRDALRHPKSAEDLVVSDASWSDIFEGAQWLFAQLFSFIEQLATKHGKY
jgi:hypothetical protein